MDTSAGIDGLVRPTAEMVSITLSSGQAKGIRHVEYLSYPDENFSSEELLSSNATVQNQIRPLEDVYRRQNETFIPGQPVQILDITAERIYNPVTEFLYPYLYTIRVRHGQFEWQIEKRYKHFHDLHKSLVNFVEHETGRSISSLNKSQLSSNGKSENDSLLDQRRKSRPCFPTQNDRVAFINQHTIEQRCGKLKQYLNDVLKHPRFREHFAMREFLEVSPITFVNGLGVSVREGAVAKRSNDDFRGRSIFARAPFVCDKCKFHHGQKWFVLKDSYLVYLNANSAVVGFPMLIDRGFELNRGFRKTGTNNGIQLKNLQRMMIIKCEKEEERDQWFASLEQIKSQSTFNCIQPLNSFAPKREKQYAHWFINGQSYMEAIAKAILAAKEEIFITDWWLSPEILLVRPADDSMRLENLLGKRAEEGIRVYVMVFKDIVSVVGLNSQHTKTRLISKSPTKKNIKVIRHPDHRVLPGTESSFLFSHHEKTVVIDQKIAFIGGIDLCWGRWDTDEHRLIDLGDTNVTKLKTAEELAAEEAAEEEEQAKKEETAQETTEKMADNAANPNPLKPVKVATADFNNPKEDNPEQTNEGDEEKTIKNRISNILHRHKSDEGEEKSKSGMTEFKNELSRLEREVLADEKNAEEKPQKFRKKRRNLLRKMDRDHQENSSDEEDEQQEATKAPNEPRTIIGTTPVAEGEHRLFLGKDYSNSYRKDFEFIDKFDEDYIERQKVARMPWHDEALVVTGQSARDCARHFIQRWNVHKADKYRYNDFYPYLLPKSENDPNLFDKTLLEEILGNDKKLIEVDSQCVRSAAFWSCGLRTIEHSIQNAYLHLIDSAQHFIYIENQFFITIANNSTIKNGIGDALYRRIIRAHNNREKFRIYVVLPLLPGFSNANAVQAVLYFIMRSINKGEKSLYQRLIQAGVNNPEDYISFYGMRNWDILMGTLVTEIIYVHSKLMIVDDRMCICGSANINDRSLLGSRDSEFCLVVHDREMVDSKLNGQIQKVGLFSSTWRKKLFRQILGVKDDQSDFVDDPCSDEFYNSFRKTARENALIYEEVFNTLPTNAVRKFIDVDEYTERPKLQKTNPAEALEKCKQIQGFVVEFPLDFLADDAMMPKWNTSEGMAPMLLWT